MAALLGLPRNSKLLHGLTLFAVKKYLTANN